MKIYCINLDRHAQRLGRMQKLLAHLPLERVDAVDGQKLSGPDRRDKSVPSTAETLTRFERACTMSHRLAWEQFLATDETHACVLEDDLIFSPDFSAFISDARWVPPDVHLIKLETFFTPVELSKKTIPARDRELAELRSFHFGTGAYIVSRRGAELLLELTADLSLAADVALFEPKFVRPLAPVMQLVPALCIQAQHDQKAMTMDELKSSIQPGWMQKKKTVWQRVKKETLRPLQQFSAAAIAPIQRSLGGSCLTIVPHA